VRTPSTASEASTLALVIAGRSNALKSTHDVVLRLVAEVVVIGVHVTLRGKHWHHRFRQPGLGSPEPAATGRPASAATAAIVVRARRSSAPKACASSQWSSGMWLPSCLARGPPARRAPAAAVARACAPPSR
jgi:hypothetical protein